MEDSGKHSALRQADDGSYEFVIDDHGLHEISEVESSVAEATVDEPRTVPAPASKRVVGIAAGGILLLLVLGVVGWVMLGPNADHEPEVEYVPGFKAYAGGGEANERTTRPKLPAVPPDEHEPEPVAEVVPEPPPAEDDEEITESEPGWELTEAEEGGVEIPPVEVVEGEAVEAEAENDGTEDAERAEGEEASGQLPGLKGRGLEGITRPGLNRGFRPPRMPSIKSNPIATGRLKPMPIRNINPVPLDTRGSDGEEGGDEAEVEEGVEQ